MLLQQILSSLILVLLLTGLGSNVNARSLRDRRFAVSYIANQTACVVDKVIYREGDDIPTDDACTKCMCRPPGFKCLLRECEVKPGCKAIRREGECCPEYQCGCEHNGKFFKDGDRIPNAESPCYSCYCQGSSITCGLADCQFRFDCEPEYVPGECCPRYDHCPPDPTRNITTTTATTATTLLSSSNSTDRPSSSSSSSDSSSETSPTPIFISSPSSPIPDSPSSSSFSFSTTLVPVMKVTTDEIGDVTTMTPIPSKSDPPGAVVEAEKQAAAAANVSSGFPQTADVTEPSSSSLNQTSKAEVLQVPVTTSAPSSSSTPDLLPAIREPVQDEVTITASNSNQSKPVTMPELPVPSAGPPVTTDGTIEIAQDEYMTTRTWLPDSALTAEHRQQPVMIKGSAPVVPETSNSTQVVPKVIVTLSTASAASLPVPLAASNSTTRVKTPAVSESPDEIRISEPAAVAGDSLLPESSPVTTAENNFVT